MLGVADMELRNHSRECGPYVSKLLDDTYRWPGFARDIP